MLFTLTAGCFNVAMLLYIFSLTWSKLCYTCSISRNRRYDKGLHFTSQENSVIVMLGHVGHKILHSDSLTLHYIYSHEHAHTNWSNQVM